MRTENLQHTVLKHWKAIMGKKKPNFDLHLILCAKASLKWITDLNLRVYTMKLQEDNTGSSHRGAVVK